MNQEIFLRSPEEAAKRAIILIGIFQASSGREKQELVEIFKKNELWSYVSEIEKQFLLSVREDDQFIALQYSWRSESAFILLWALNQIKTITIPKNEENLELISNFLKDPLYYENISIKDAQFRDEREISKLLEQVRVINLELRDAELLKQESLHEYHPSIVYEWLYALSWLTNQNMSWDDFSTDKEY